MANLLEGSDHGDSFLRMKEKTASFALEAEESTERSVLQRTWTAPLNLGVGGVLVALGKSVRIKQPAA